MNFKPALSYLTQGTEYFRGPVYTAQERNESRYGSVHHASSMLGQASSKLNAKQSQSEPHLRTPNYSNDGQGNVRKAAETFHPNEATPDEDSYRNDPDKQDHLLKLPQDSYSGPDSYLTITPASSKAPPLPPLGTYQLETPKEIHQSPNAHYQTQKAKESFIRHGDQYQIPSSTEFYKPIMINLQPLDPNEPYKGHLDGYQFQPPKQTYEPQTGVYQYANMKESMKQPQHTQKPPKPKEYNTPTLDTYQLPESKDSSTNPAKILQPPKSKNSFKPPTSTYHDIKLEDSLTPTVDMQNHPESEDLFKQYMGLHKPPNSQDILSPPLDMYEYPKLNDSYKLQRDRHQPQKQNYIFQGGMESYRPLPAKEIHKPLVLSPEEFYKPPTKLQMPAKDDNKTPSSSETVQELSQPFPLTHANNHSEDIDDDIYFDYDPSTYVQKEIQKENSNGHAHNDSHKYDYSALLHGIEQIYSHEYDHLAEQLHAPERNHSHKYPSHDYSGFYLHPPPSFPNHSNAAPPHPPKEQPSEEILEVPPPPAKETDGLLSPPPSEPHEAPPPSSKEPYGATFPLHLDPYGAPMYLPEQTHAAPIHPPNYVYGIHAFEYPYGVPPAPHATISPPPPTPPAKHKRVEYYHIGLKLYVVPAVFTFLFMPFMLAYIIRSVIRHKVKAPFTYWQTARKIDLDKNEMERRVATALDAVEKRYK
jgi:hypothetical protein